MHTRLAIAVFSASALLAIPRVAWAQPAPDAPAPVKDNELTPPVLLRNAEPAYPAEAMKEGRTATVLLLLDIDETGRVTNASVKESGGYGFDEAAQEAALRLVFEPAKRQGQNIRARIVYSTRFEAKPQPQVQAAQPPSPPPSATLGGVIRLAQAEAPLPNATIVVHLPDGRTLKTQSDAQGKWELAGVVAGAVSVEVSAPGYTTASFSEHLKAGETIEVVYRVRIQEETLEVRVHAARPDREVTKRTMQRQELALVPGTGGDALRAIQAMPSVARTNPFSGQIVVRGSAPTGTALFVDGTPVPIAYHFGGLSSVIPTEMIEAIDFFPGNFSARYGRVHGGVVDVRLREREHDGKTHGLAQVDLIDARLMLTGPVPYLKDWSFMVAGRRSHVDAWISGLMGDGATIRRAPVYYDWQAFAETKPTAKSFFRIGMFGSDDRIALTLGDAQSADPAFGSSFSESVRTMRTQAIYRNAFSDRVALSTTVSAGLDQGHVAFGPIQADETYHPFAVRGELSWKMADSLTLRVGPDAVFTHYDAKIRSIQPPDETAPDPGPLSTRPILSLNRSGWFSRPAGYAELAFNPMKRMDLLFGGRVDYDQMSKSTDISPRFNARYALRDSFPRSTIKTGVGMFYQPPQLVESDKVFGTPSLQSNRSVHYSLGLEQDLTNAVNLSVEGFWKDLDNLVVTQPKEDGSTGYDNIGKGRVVGAELMLRHRPVGRFFGWIAYTLSRSTRIDAPGKAERLFEHDQTHILTALGSYDLGRGWKVGARFRLISGNPYTPCLGGIQNAGSGTYACRTGDTYSRRFPAYHQADLRADKTWTFPSWKLTAYLDIQNAYNRSNPEAVEYNYNYTRTRFQAGLPMIPSLGLRGEF